MPDPYPKHPEIDGAFARDPGGVIMERDEKGRIVSRRRADGLTTANDRKEINRKTSQRHLALKRPPKDAEKVKYQADPAFVAADKASHLMTGTHSNTVGKQLYLGYKPRDYFVPFHQRYQRFSCIVAHRRAGKTVAALMDTIHKALKDTSGTGRYAFCGPTYAQIKDVVWSYLKQYTYPLPNTKVNEAELSVRLLNGSTIRLYSLDSTAYERMRGIYLDGCTIDEYEDCDPRALPEVIRPALSDRQGWLSIIGTAKTRGAFFKQFRYAQKHPDEWYSAVFKASETDAIHPEELRQMRDQMGPNEYARELECSFEVEGYDQLVSGADIEEARDRAVPADPNLPVVFGVDVARFGDDRSVLVVREGQRLVDCLIWKGKDLMETAQRVANHANLYRPRMIFVDGIGVGGGVIDRLRHLGFTNVEDVNVARKAADDRKFANHRAECYARLRDWLRKDASIHENFKFAQEFEDDVTSITYTYDNRGRLLIESKDDLKAKGLPSPDIADAVALTFSQQFPTYDVARLNGRGQQSQYVAEIPDLLEQW